MTIRSAVLILLVYLVVFVHATFEKPPKYIVTFSKDASQEFTTNHIQFLLSRGYDAEPFEFKFDNGTISLAGYVASLTPWDVAMYSSFTHISSIEQERVARIALPLFPKLVSESDYRYNYYKSSRVKSKPIVRKN